MKVKFQSDKQLVSEWDLSDRQEKFLVSDAKYVCYSGGMGCGKSLALVLKIIDLMLRYPKNYGLLGRVNFSDLRDTTVKDFFDACPPQYIKSYNKQEKQVTFHNGSQLIFRGLKDVKRTEVRSLNLGFFCLEQAEEIDESLFNELSARLRRRITDFDGKEGKQQGMLICNPALTWIFKKFVQAPIPDSELIEGSMMDNEKNLPESYVRDMLSKPEQWKRQFVYGIWDESLLAEKAVFASEYIQEQAAHIRNPMGILDEIQIFKQPEAGHFYQAGVDPSEGAEDSSVIKVVDKETGEEMAKYQGKIQPDLLGNIVAKMGRHYNNARVVLEINGIGLATLAKLKEVSYEYLYVREEFDKQAKVMTERLGWRTTHASKPLLIGHFQELLGHKRVKIRDQATLNEMKTFVYSDEAKRKGMGAERGFHDDNIMAHMLACVDIKGEQGSDEDKFVVTPNETRIPTGERLHLQEFINVPKMRSWLER